MKCSSNQNTEFMKIIPELNKLGTDEKILNPRNVIEFKDGEPIKHLQSHHWDESKVFYLKKSYGKIFDCYETFLLLFK